MGLFGKIKANLSHGGVTVVMVAPQNISQAQTSIHIEATITAGDTPQVVNQVTAALEVEHLANVNDPNQHTPPPSVLAHQEYATPFQLAAGQSAPLSFDVPFDRNAILGQSNSATAQLAGVLDKLNTAYNATHGYNFQHLIVVTADVEGIAIDPKARQRVVIEGMEAPGTYYNGGVTT